MCGSSSSPEHKEHFPLATSCSGLDEAKTVYTLASHGQITPVPGDRYVWSMGGIGIGIGISSRQKKFSE